MWAHDKSSTGTATSVWVIKRASDICNDMKDQHIERLLRRTSLRTGVFE